MSWLHLLGNKKKLINQKEDGTLLAEITNEFNTKRPKGLLEVEIMKDKKYVPMSVGDDNYLYGLNHGNKRMIRSNDGFESIESGYDFFGNGIGVPEFVTKTPTGYLVYVNHNDGLTASVWHSDSFTDGFEKVLDLTNGYVAGGFIPRPWHNIERGIVMVAEYSTEKDITRYPRAWISRDGGLTWKMIDQLKDKDPSTNFHYHAMCYDPWQSRIYLSNGDQVNAELKYSDDWGETWHKIEDDNTQPTLLEPMAKRVVSCPDAFDVVSINTIEKQVNNDFTIKPFMRKAIKISNIPAYGNFGKGPVGGLVGSDEMYITFSESGSGVKKCFIVATGDGGESWHLVATLEPNNGNGLARGLVSDPNTGYMYGWYVGDIFGDGTRSHLAKIHPLEWE
jgi:hypothetical protein